jgi:hypothetical protein
MQAHQHVAIPNGCSICERRSVRASSFSDAGSGNQDKLKEREIFHCEGNEK